MRNGRDAVLSMVDDSATMADRPLSVLPRDEVIVTPMLLKAEPLPGMIAGMGMNASLYVTWDAVKIVCVWLKPTRFKFGKSDG